MDIKALQAVASVERKLEEKSALEQLKRIEPYIKDVPMAAQVASYIKTYHQPIPENHQVFSYISDFEKRKNQKQTFSKENGKDPEKEESAYGEEEKKDDNKNTDLFDIIDKSLKEMEEENDKLWYFLEQHRMELQSDYEFRSKFMQIRSYLKNNKSILKRFGR